MSAQRMFESRADFVRLLLLADESVGLEITRYLIADHANDIALVVTAERNPIFDAAEAAGIDVCIYESDQALLPRISAGIDLGILAWWPRILKGPLLDIPRNGFVNTHPSLLPFNRGKHYNFWAIVEENPFGVTLHRANSGIDTGEIIAQNVIEYDWTDNGETLYRKAQGEMVKLFQETYPLLRNEAIASQSQNLESGSFHRASELDAASCIKLDREYPARALLNLLRARTFEGYPGCWFEEDGVRYEIFVSIRKVENE